MGSYIRSLFSIETEEQKYNLRKLLLLSGCYFLGVFAFSIIKPLKQSIFLGFIGSEYQPMTRFLSLLLVPIVMAGYSKMVDKFRRHQVVMLSMLIYAVGSLLFAYFFWHPVFGIANTEKSYFRLLGWFFYVFGDFYQIFIIGSFWSFTNSITTTEFAKKSYGTILAISKIAGISSPILSDYILMNSGYSDAVVIPLLIAFTSLMLVGSAFMIFYLKRSVPGKYLHGYEVVYRLEKEKAKQHVKETGILEGIRLMITQPYVFGIFGLVFSYEIISTIMDYQMLAMADLHYKGNLSAISSFMLKYTAAFQGIGLLFALFGTNIFLKLFDVKICLLISPLLTIGLLSFVYYNPSLYVVTAFMIMLRALNYGFNLPIKEMLYIPTIKDIKFKSKAWTDSFGRTISKSAAASYNLLTAQVTEASRIMVGSTLSIFVAMIWVTIALMIGRKYAKVIDNKEAIGDEAQKSLI